MRRMVWVAVGAAGGIYAYRRAQQAMVDARDRGVVLSAQQVGLSAVAAVNSARSLAASPAATPSRIPGAAAARALAASRRRTDSSNAHDINKESGSGLR